MNRFLSRRRFLGIAGTLVGGLAISNSIPAAAQAARFGTPPI